MLINKKQYDFFRLFDKYTKDASNGKRLQKSGKPIRKSSISNYYLLRQLLENFSIQKGINLRIIPIQKLKTRELQAEKNIGNNFIKISRTTCIMIAIALIIMLAVT